MISAKQYLGNLSTNLRAFLTNDFHTKSGMKCLIESFYRSIVEGTPVPIPYREILLTARIMDAIFAQLHEQQSQCQAHQHVHSTLTSGDKVVGLQISVAPITKTQLYVSQNRR